MTKKRTGKGSDERPLNWPDEAENITAADIDFEALAHVLANSCRRVIFPHRIGPSLGYGKRRTVDGKEALQA